MKKISQNLIGFFTLDSNLVEKGDTVQINYKLYNSGLFPLPFMIIVDGISSRLSSNGGEKSVHYLKSSDSIIISRTIRCEHRGYYQLGNIKVITGDVFGITKKEIQVRDDLFLTVYPKVYLLKNLNIYGKEFFGNKLANLKYYEDYSSVKNLRKYQRGDSIKKIHWKATARKGEFLVKNYDIAANIQLMIYMDFQQSKYSLDKDELIEEKVVECVISIVYYSLINNINFELETYADEKIQLLGKDISMFKEFLELMSRIRPVRNINIGNVILDESKILSRGTTIIIVTPEIDSHTLFAILILKSKEYSLIVIVVSNFKFKKTLEKHINLLKKAEIRIYKIDIEDNIIDVMR